MDVQVLRNRGVDSVEEFAEFGGAMTSMKSTDDFSSGHVKGGEQDSAYSYERADYICINVSYEGNMRFSDIFSPEWESIWPRLKTKRERRRVYSLRGDQLKNCELRIRGGQ